MRWGCFWCRGPLGDSHDRGNLSTILLAGVTLALIGVAISPSSTWLGAVSLLLGFTTVVPQILVPLAAILSPAETRWACRGDGHERVAGRHRRRAQSVAGWARRSVGARSIGLPPA